MTLLGNREQATLEKVESSRYKLTQGYQSWLLSKRVDGEIRPFSMFVLKTNGRQSGEETNEVLKIKDHLFLHNGNFYMIGGVPESRPPKDHLVGAKFITRLTKFPFTHHDDIDLETRSRLKRHRGKVVGEIYGLGSKGFHAKIEKELNEIGFPLTASAYLIYSSV